MKTQLFFRTAFLAVATCCLFTFTMCKKDKENSGPLPSQSQRITSYEYYFNDTLEIKMNFQYSGNLIASYLMSMALDTGWAEYEKGEVAYSGNAIASMTSYLKQDDSWRKSDYYQVNGYSGESPLEIEYTYYSSGGSNYRSKNQFTYVNALLTKMEEFGYDGSTWYPGGTTYYSYDSQGRILRETDTSMYYGYGYITTYTYEGNKMTQELKQQYYSGTLTDYTKTLYQYSGDKVSVTSGYDNNAGTWEKSVEITFGYNSQGNLASEEIAEFGNYNYSYRIEFKYGTGQGNYRKCAQVLQLMPLLPGDPTPMPVKSTRSVSDIVRSLRFISGVQ